MADIINLRRARKVRTRAAEDAQAAENRTRFGRSKAERKMAEAEAEIAQERVEGHRLAPTEDT